MTAGAELRRSARSGVVGLTAAVLNGALGFVLAVVVTRGFGPAGAGAMFVLIGLVTVAGVACCLGADTALVWALPRRVGTAGAARLLPVAAAPGLAVGVAVAAAGVLTAPALAPVLLGPGGGGGEAALRLAFAAVPVAVATTLALAAVRGMRPVGAYAGLQLVALPASRPLLVGAAALAGGGVLAGTAGFLLPLLPVLLAAWLLLVHPLRAPGTALWTPPRRADWRTVWGFALPRAASAAIDSGGMWVGVWLTAALASPAAAGVFGAVGRYAVAGLVALHGLRVAVAPQLSRLLGGDRHPEAAAVHRQTTAWVVTLAWPLYLLLAWFSPGFLSVFGPEFGAGATALTVLAVAMLVSTGLGNVQTLLLMSGHSGWHLLAVAAGLASTVGWALLLTPRYGVSGAALAWGTGIVVENVIAATAARRLIGQPLWSAAVARTAGVVLAAAGGAGAVAAAVAGRGVAGLALALAILAAAVAVPLAARRVRRRLVSEVKLLMGRRRSDVDDPEPVAGGGAAGGAHPDPAGAGALRGADG